MVGDGGLEVSEGSNVYGMPLMVMQYSVVTGYPWVLVSIGYEVTGYDSMVVGCVGLGCAGVDIGPVEL